jgi:hypothetical protein
VDRGIVKAGEALNALQIIASSDSPLILEETKQQAAEILSKLSQL